MINNYLPAGIIYPFNFTGNYYILGYLLNEIGQKALVRRFKDLLKEGKSQGRGGLLKYFLTGCAARGLKPLPILRIFLPQKMTDLVLFFLQFLKIRTHF